MTFGQLESQVGQKENPRSSAFSIWDAFCKDSGKNEIAAVYVKENHGHIPSWQRQSRLSGEKDSGK
ncbi:MAG: hypothetical protein KUG74_06715 [Rhodobacteraceae bacterium]|nr:hypothetical protein [Paracoccaceae bacterium]